MWDTVGALGIPQGLLAEKVLRTARKYKFHDPSLSSRVRSARHAVAIDEDRVTFEPALWDNIDALEAGTGNQELYQQRWFPGDHGSVGGGGDIVGLSTGALLWVLEGAQRMGLEFDATAIQKWDSLADPDAPLRNRKDAPGPFSRIYRRAPRQGFSRWEDLSKSAEMRLRSESKSLAPKPYRPKTLECIFERLGNPPPG